MDFIYGLIKKWWSRAGLNRRHTDFQSVALPTELLDLFKRLNAYKKNPASCPVEIGFILQDYHPFQTL